MSVRSASGSSGELWEIGADRSTSGTAHPRPVHRLAGWRTAPSSWSPAACLALGIAASLLAGRLRVPGLLLFLGLGMVIGSDVLGLIDFGGDVEDVELARTIGDHRARR